MTDAAPLPSTLILAIPGTQETKEMPLQDVLAAISRGEIAPDNWVWSPLHNDWKMVSEIPELQVAPAPEPAPPVTNVAVPAAAMSAHFPPATGKTPAAAQPAAAVVRQATPMVQPKAQGRVPALTESQQLARTQYSKPMEVKHEFPIFKVLFFVSFVLASGVLGLNYFLVDEPFTANLATTSFSTVKAYAHLGAFSQPGALVIHVPPNKDLTSDNFADFLAALAKSTPPQPFNQQPFQGVGLTSAWQSQYVMNGIDWQKLGDMVGASTEEKKKFEVEHLAQIDGTLLVNTRKGQDPAVVTEAENKAWQSLVTNFVPKTSNQ